MVSEKSADAYMLFQDVKVTLNILLNILIVWNIM